MSASEHALPLPAAESMSQPSSRASLSVRLVQRLERAGEWLNPILIKESRQALKSRQFAIMFTLLLVGSWLWSIAGIAFSGTNAYFGFAGRDMFFGYYFALAFALLVIVPFTAFRSLAAECEDRTFELVSITTLHPRQIIAGKLGSAVVQMLVYLSALAPCLAFTYLLRGIDLLQIVFILTYLLAGSLGFSMISLLISTAGREKHWQIVLSLVLIIWLLIGFYCGGFLAYVILEDNVITLEHSDFWIGHALGLILYVGYFALFFLAAAAQLTFASDNRSTALRATMLVQFLMMIGWIAAVAVFEQRNRATIDANGPLIAFMTLSGFHWSLMGMFMVIDQPNLSPRVKRRLPQSFLGRVFLTWFNPGPGTGYMLVVCNLIGASIVSLVALFWLREYGYFTASIGARRFFWDEPAAVFAVLLTAYVVFYMGLGKLVISLLRRRWPVGLFAGLALQVSLLLIGCGVPLILHVTILAWRPDYERYIEFLHLTNPFLVLSQAAENRSFFIGLPVFGRVISALALIVFSLNLPGIIREVRHVRIAAPSRVTEDDAAPPV